MSDADRQQRVHELFARRVQQAFPSTEEAINRVAGGQSLAIYYGIDPTGPDVHLGHVVQLILLKELESLGHTITILIGDFTARIGDPTGKDVGRKALTEDEVESNAATYLDQIKKVVPDNQFRVEHNSEWLSGLTMEQVLKLTSMATVQQMLAREMFQERLKNEQPIHVSEFLYPLMQGYDSVAMKVDGEVGGNDQIFNMLVGRDLERELIGKDKLVLATRLLTDSGTGKKMSKSEGTLIAVNDSPQEIRRKTLNVIGDDMVRSVFGLCTAMEKGEIDALEKKFEGDPRGFKEALSDALVALFHGKEQVAPSRAPEEARPGMLTDVLVAAGAADSTSVAKRLIDQGAVEVNDIVVKEWKHEVRSGDRIQIGKGRFVKITE
ncbi:MAG TPA: tyrosine--tRNA ligase [Candidatus Paceibacterota bacterium]|nr:tyrosine--tRNA ligase [Candidatus Paceibacterota bacterium]